MTLCDQLKSRLADAQTTQLHLATPSSSGPSAEQQGMTPVLHKIWRDEDEDYRYGHFADFNA